MIFIIQLLFWNLIFVSIFKRNQSKYCVGRRSDGSCSVPLAAPFDNFLSWSARVRLGRQFWLIGESFIVARLQRELEHLRVARLQRELEHFRVARLQRELEQPRVALLQREMKHFRVARLQGELDHLRFTRLQRELEHLRVVRLQRELEHLRVARLHRDLVHLRVARLRRDLVNLRVAWNWQVPPPGNWGNSDASSHHRHTLLNNTTIVQQIHTNVLYACDIHPVTPNQYTVITLYSSSPSHRKYAINTSNGRKWRKSLPLNLTLRIANSETINPQVPGNHYLIVWLAPHPSV